MSTCRRFSSSRDSTTSSATSCAAGLDRFRFRPRADESVLVKTRGSNHPRRASPSASASRSTTSGPGTRRSPTSSGSR
jgi:hypothetical protein